MRMVLREVLVLAAAGLAIGMGRRSHRIEIREIAAIRIEAQRSAWRFRCAVFTLLGAALLAGYVPARKASRIDPMNALRHE